MQNKLVIVFLFFGFLTSCSSTHTLMVYKVNCNVNPNFLNDKINEKGFEFEKVEDYQVCKDFHRYKITRNNITHNHLDGRSFKIKKSERLFYAKYDKSSCELTVVTPWDGRVTDFQDTNHILNEYYYGPLVSKVGPPSENDVIYSKEISFSSESNLKKFCEKNNCRNIAIGLRCF